MLKRIKQFFKEQPKKIIVLKNSSFTREQAEEISRLTGRIALLTDDVNDVRLPEDVVAEGDGDAVFFGEGTTEEYEDMLKEDEGMKPWYDRLKNMT